MGRTIIKSIEEHSLDENRNSKTPTPLKSDLIYIFVAILSSKFRSQNSAQPAPRTTISKFKVRMLYGLFLSKNLELYQTVD